MLLMLLLLFRVWISLVAVFFLGLTHGGESSLRHNEPPIESKEGFEGRMIC